MGINKNILITGAGNGIGLELVKIAANQGHKVIAVSRNINSIKSLAGIDSYSIDITKERLVKSLITKLKSKNIRLDIIINNAGALVNKPFEKTTIEAFKRLYDVNVFGVASIIRQSLPIINKNGHVINISSMGGVQGSSKFSGLSAYSSSKGALIILTELLAEEFNKTGPSFNALALGAVQTKMLEKAFPGYESNTTPKQMAEYILNFSLSGHRFFNGKVIPVSLSTP